ncbi:MAG: P-loop NTPase, partial [Thermoplasmata archaeon]
MYKCTSWSFNNTIPCFSFIYLTWQISYIFSKKYKTGILDLDLHGPSIPFILGINNIKIIESENGIFPVEWNNIKVMSLDIFMQGRAAPLRGSSKNEIIKEMVGITDFGNLDYLIIDMPPGTGDEYLSTIEIFREKGEIIFITAPSKISWLVSKRAIDIAKNQI